MDAPIFDDEYKGERWTYGLRYRPLGFGNTPKGWIIGSNREHPDFKNFGTVDYPFRLSDEVIKSFELVEIQKEKP